MKRRDIPNYPPYFGATFLNDRRIQLFQENGKKYWLWDSFYDRTQVHEISQEVAGLLVLAFKDMRHFKEEISALQYDLNRQ